MRNKKLLRRTLTISITVVLLAAALFFLYDRAERFVYPEKYKDYVLEYSEKYQLDPYLVFAIIKVESNFNPDAMSPRKAKGLMQISDRTGKWGAQTLKLGNYTPESLLDPETNISIGCWYLNTLGRQYGGDRSLMLAAYNAGSGNVDSWLKDRSLSSSGKSLDRVPFRETDAYLKKVAKSYDCYKRLYENNHK